jgi:hypothetical protein
MSIVPNSKILFISPRLPRNSARSAKTLDEMNLSFSPPPATD